MDFFVNYQDRIVSVCRKFKVEKIYAFGSTVSGKYKNNSDVDLIVFLEKMPPEKKGETLLALWDELEALFGRRVDLLTDKRISNPILNKNIENSKILLYDRTNAEILV